MPATWRNAGESQSDVALLRVVAARWAASPFFSPQAQPMQGATQGWRTHPQFGLPSNACLQLGERYIRLSGDQLLHRHVMMKQGARAPTCMRQGSTAAAVAPSMQEFFNERFTDTEFVSEFLLGVVIVVFMKADDSFTEVVRKG